MTSGSSTTITKLLNTEPLSADTFRSALNSAGFNHIANDTVLKQLQVLESTKSLLGLDEKQRKQIMLTIIAQTLDELKLSPLSTTSTTEVKLLGQCHVSKDDAVIAITEIKKISPKGIIILEHNGNLYPELSSDYYLPKNDYAKVCTLVTECELYSPKLLPYRPDTLNI